MRKIPRILHKILKRDFAPDVKLIPMHSTKKIEIPHRNVDERIKDFEEVELKAPNEELKKEACRCLTCPLKYKP